jgi:hypothetical protein
MASSPQDEGRQMDFHDREAAAVEHRSDNLSSKLGEIQNQRDGEART